MGLYDYLNDEQVKCFYVPVYSEALVGIDAGHQLCHSGGNLKHYSNGDKLPLNTEYYNYPQNMLIFDRRTDFLYQCPKCKNIGPFGDSGECPKCGARILPSEQVLAVFHLIKDGKLLDTVYSIDEIPDDFMDYCELVCDYTGEPLFDMQTKEELEYYISSLRTLTNTIHEISLKYSKTSLRFITEFKKQKDGKAPKDAEKLKKYIEENEASCLARDKEVKAVQEEFDKKFQKYKPKNVYSELTAYMEFGEYISCYESMLIRSDPETKKLLPDIKRDFKEFLNKNKNILAGYFAWANTTPHRQLEIKSLLTTL